MSSPQTRFEIEPPSPVTFEVEPPKRTFLGTVGSGLKSFGHTLFDPPGTHMLDQTYGWAPGERAPGSVGDRNPLLPGEKVVEAHPMDMPEWQQVAEGLPVIAPVMRMFRGSAEQSTKSAGQVQPLIEQGRYSEAAGHGLASAVPGGGIAEASGEAFGRGDNAEALGDAALALAPYGMHAVMPRVPGALKTTGEALQKAAPYIGKGAEKAATFGGVGEFLHSGNPMSLAGPVLSPLAEKAATGVAGGFGRLLSRTGETFTPKPTPPSIFDQPHSGPLLFGADRPGLTPDTFNGLPRALPAGPTITPPPADTSGSVPFTPPPVAATTRAQRLGLILPESTASPIQLGSGEVLPPEPQSGVFRAQRAVDPQTGRVQYLTSPAEPSQGNMPAINPDGPPPQRVTGQPPLRDFVPQQSSAASVWPPERPSAIQPREFRGRADSLDDRGFQEAMQSDLESHGRQAYSQNKREWFGRNVPGSTKGDLTAQAPRTFSLSGTETPNAPNPVTDAISQATAQGQPILPPEPPAQAPRYAYRSRNAGETGIMPRGKPQASLDPSKVEGYMEGRSAAENHPQELVRTDLNKLDPSEYVEHPNGYVEFKSPVPESFIEKAPQKPFQLPSEQPQVPTDENMESLLMKSIQRTRAPKTFSATGGDD